MQEAVIFPKPEEVNIIATRNGELTNIPGTEFRTPLAPYQTLLRFNPAGMEPYLLTDTDVTPIPISMFYESSGLKYTYAKCLNIFEERLEIDDDKSKVTYFDAQLLKSKSPPSTDRIGLMVQLIGNKTTHILDHFTDPPSSDDEAIVTLPPCHSERFLIVVANNINPAFYLPYA